MDYISHHALHSHIPVHHYTNHTAVTIHSLVLIVSPHLHLIHSFQHLSGQHLLGMDTRVLFALKQGSRSLENHIREFLACAHYSDLPDIILIDIFCDGINQPLQTQLRREGPRSSLSCFLEFALLTVGSLFTVGVTDEDRDTASCHKMAAGPEPHNSPAKQSPHSLGQGSLLRPGGHLLRCGGLLSCLLRPGGRLSRLLRPGGRLSHLLRPGGRLSRLLRPGGRLICQSHSTSPLTCQSHSTSPLTCQSHSTSPPTCQSHSKSPPTSQSHSTSTPTCQSHSTSPPTCQSHLTSPPTCQGHSTSPPTCQSHLTSPPTCQGHLTSPLTCQSHLTSPLTCQSHLTSPLTCQSHLTSPLTCQSHLTSPLTCQSHLTSPLTCQSHLTPPLTCQSHLTSQRSTQCPFTSLLSRPPCPGGLLSHWPHMDLALRPLPRFQGSRFKVSLFVT